MRALLFVVLGLVLLTSMSFADYKVTGPYKDHRTKTGPNEVDSREWDNDSNQSETTKYARTFSDTSEVWGDEEDTFSAGGTVYGWSFGFKCSLTNGQRYTQTESSTVTVDPITIGPHSWKSITVNEWDNKEREYFQIFYDTVWGPDTGFLEPERWRSWPSWDYDLNGGPRPLHPTTPPYGEHPVHLASTDDGGINQASNSYVIVP